MPKKKAKKAQKVTGQSFEDWANGLPPRVQCKVCALSDDAVGEVKRVLDAHKSGKTTKSGHLFYVSLAQMVERLRARYGYGGGDSALSSHVRKCLKRDWATGRSHVKP